MGRSGDVQGIVSDGWERDLAKMGIGWTVGMLLGIAVLLALQL